MKLISLDLDRNRATFSNGRVLSYEHLISTIPLDLLIGTIELSKTSLPVTQRSLRANPLTLAHILIPRENVGDGLHWIYVPQPEIPFYRITFPQNIGPTTCPVGWSALTLEIGGEVFDKPKVESKCMSALLKLGLLMHHELGVEVVWDFLRHGYITHDRNLMGSRSNILGYLRDKGVVCIGRYGRWEYSNMEAALIQGREIRKRLAVYNENKKSRLALPATATNSSVRNYFARYYPDRYSKLAGLTFRRGESDRLDCIRKWVPHTEALTILDAGCGDGNFLAEVMHGKAAKVRLEDFVSANVELAKRRIQFKADIVETATADLKGSGDGSTYDLVLAIGIFDYEHDWELLFSRLLSRCRGMLIADFPKSGTFHQRLRKIWLRRQGIVLESCCRSHLEDLFAQWRLKSDIADLPLQWMTKIDMRKEWE